uniref:Uncharacterized protein n=1 Tax=Rhodnius prolixus TaxID=13249 RepID=T1HEJ6_RHOPR
MQQTIRTTLWCTDVARMKALLKVLLNCNNFLVAQRKKQKTFPAALESQVSKVGHGLSKASFKNFNC